MTSQKFTFIPILYHRRLCKQEICYSNSFCVFSNSKLKKKKYRQVFITHYKIKRPKLILYLLKTYQKKIKYLIIFLY